MPLPAALLPALLLGLLWPGAVRGRSPPARLPSGLRQRRWDAALFARSVARLPAERRDAARDGDYLLGIKRLRRLYCNVGIGFHIQVLPDGRIEGVHSENRYSKAAQGPRRGRGDAPRPRDRRRAVLRSGAPDRKNRVGAWQISGPSEAQGAAPLGSPAPSGSSGAARPGFGAARRHCPARCPLAAIRHQVSGLPQHLEDPQEPGPPARSRGWGELSSTPNLKSICWGLNPVAP